MSSEQSFTPGSARGPSAADRLRLSGVVMRLRPLVSRWQAYAWMPTRLEDAPGLASPRLLWRSEGVEEWLHPELAVELFRDEAEGYYLNMTAPAPAAFVRWSDEENRVSVLGLTLSYHQGARWMDGGMQVDTVPLPADWTAWLDEFTRAHYRPDTARPRSRPPSFRGARRTASDG
jgi:hypothetical protein